MEKLTLKELKYPLFPIPKEVLKWVNLFREELLAYTGKGHHFFLCIYLEQRVGHKARGAFERCFMEGCEYFHPKTTCSLESVLVDIHKQHFHDLLDRETYLSPTISRDLRIEWTKQLLEFNLGETL